MFRAIYLGMCSASVLVVLSLASSSQASSGETLDGERYLDSARQFADRVLADGRDKYGKRPTPLFVDGLHVETLRPIEWKWRGETWVLSNFASQQPLVRLLDGLTGLTGEAKYRDAAEAAAGYALEHARTPNGFLYWGGHLAWDLTADKGVEPQGPWHEMKYHRPHFALMWRVDRPHTVKLMETIWAAHIVDWALLDFNRHAPTRRTVSIPWNHEFRENVEVPFARVGGKNLSFVNAGGSLMHAGVMLSTLEQSEDALKWTRRLVRRWQQAEDPKTGLCGARLSYMNPKADRAQKALRHVHPEICEAKVVNNALGRYRCFALAQLQDAETLIKAGGPYADVGREFLRWASDDLKTYAEQCYDPKSGQFVARMTNGTAIRWRETRVGYFKADSFAPTRPGGELLWGYATAYRLTGDAAHWRMGREIAAQMAMGEIGSSDGQGQSLDLTTGNSDWLAIYAMLELHEATGNRQFLKLAARIADNLIETQTPTGLFAPGPRGYSHTGDERPLALVHLAAAIQGKRAAVPPAAFDSRFFHARHDALGGKGRIYDTTLY